MKTFRLIIPDSFGRSWISTITRDNWDEAIKYVQNIERILKQTVLLEEITYEE